jgi:hypothetical protein
LQIDSTTGIVVATYSLPIASQTQLGGVKIDGSSITINNGVISAVGGGGGGGGVASVGALYPLASSGGTTPQISITGTIAIENGGTDATTAVGARTNLLPIQSASNGAFLRTNGTDTVWQLIDTGIITSGLGYTPLSTGGGTMTGTLTLAGSPTQTNQAATKQYVDSVATGLQIHLPVRTASTSALTATYSNGTAGVGATLSSTGSLPSIGGLSLNVGDRVLIKDQAAETQNGVYEVTTASPNWLLTRAGDFDNSTPNEVTAGDTLYVQEGTLNGTQWVMITPGTVTIGTSNITFAQFGGPGTYDAGTGINISGTTITNVGVTSLTGSTNIAVSAATGSVTVSFTGTLGVVDGGTGAKTFTAGTYLKGNGTSAISTATTIPVTDISGILPVSKGGTGQSSFAANSLLYAASATTVTSLVTGTDGHVLTMFNGVPSWRPGGGGGGGSYSISAETTATLNAVSLSLAGSDGSNDIVNFVGGSNVTMTRTDANTITIASSGGGGASGVSSFSAGTSGFTPSSPTTGSIVLTGTLLVSHGGTGRQSFTAGTYLKGNGTNAISTATTIPVADISGILTADKGGIGFGPQASDANKLLAVNSTGSGYVLTTAGSGTVTSVGLVVPAGLSVTGSPITSAGTMTITTSLNGIVKGNGSGLVIASTATDYQVPITLTTTGTSGAATFNGTTLNIPQYSGGGGSGVSSISATSPVIVNTSTGAVTVSFTSTLLASQGGTSFSTYATGDLIYASAANTLAKRAAGATGTVLTMSGGVPTWQTPSGGGLSTVSAGTGTSVVQSGNTATVSITTATTSVVGGVKVGSGLSITADGTLSASGGGGGSSPEVVIFRYNPTNQFSGTGYGVISQTSGVTATVTNAASNIVRLVFNGRTTPPKSFIVYGQNGAPTGTTWRVTPVAVLSTFTATGIVISGSPPNPLSIMDSINNAFQITLTTTVSNISGTEAYAIMVIGF